jgi:hypothetical protein
MRASPEIAKKLNKFNIHGILPKHRSASAGNAPITPLSGTAVAFTQTTDPMAGYFDLIKRSGTNEGSGVGQRRPLRHYAVMRRFFF